MKKSNFLKHYVNLAPVQLALIRSQEAACLSQIEFSAPILDIGCSDGIFGEVLFEGKKDAINTGIDVDKQALNLAKNRRVYKKVLQADARSLPLKNQSFTTVISNQSLEHIENIDLVLQEINRVLKKNGQLVFLVPTVFLDDYWLTSFVFKKMGLKKVSIITFNFRNKIFQHINLLPQKVWQDKLKKAGFKLESHQYVGSFNRYFISELFWSIRIPQMLLGKILQKEILLPCFGAIFLAQLIEKFTKDEHLEKKFQGPTMLMVATKY